MKKTIEWMRFKNESVLVTTSEGEVLTAYAQFVGEGTCTLIDDVVAVAALPEPYEDEDDRPEAILR